MTDPATCDKCGDAEATLYVVTLNNPSDHGETETVDVWLCLACAERSGL